MPVVNTSQGHSTAAQAGRAPKRARSSEAASPLEYASNFVLLAHPLRWDVFMTDNGPEILPSVTKLEFQPGIAGVLPVRGESDGDPSYALTVKRAKGWIEVDPDIEVSAFGERRTGYVQVYDGKSGPDTHHCDVWTRPYSVAGALYFDRDQQGFWKFLRDVRDHVLPPLDENVKRGLQRKLIEMLNTSKAASGRSHSAAQVAEDIRAKLTVFDGGGDAAPAGRSRGGRAPKAAPRATMQDDGGEDA